MSPKAHDDRRKHRRVPSSLACVLVGEDGREEPFDLVDLSESGVRLRARDPIPAMTRVRVAMVLPADRVDRGDDTRLDTTGVVVWSHPVEDDEGGKQFDTGVFFPELDDGQRDLLNAYVLSAARSG